MPDVSSGSIPALRGTKKRTFVRPDATYLELRARDPGGLRYARPSGPLSGPGAYGVSTRSRSSLPALKCGTNFPGTETLLPDFGFLPVRGGR